MRGSHVAVIVGGCATIIAAGLAAAPPFTVGTGADPGTGPDPDPTSAPNSTAASGSETFDGPAVTNVRGSYQAQITVVDGVVTDVAALQAGTSAPESVAVNTMAIPEFTARVLEAQTWDVEAVSGASFTSPAFLESLQGAFEAAGLE